MKLETFFEKFDQFADAPGAVAKMRELVLQLAVTGRLVPQDPNDEPAKITAEQNEELTSESPFEIPVQWAWTHLSELSEINGGFAFKSTAYTEDGMRVVRISDFDEFGFKDHKVVRHPFSSDLQKFTLAEQNILMAMTGGTVGKSYFVRALPEPMIVNQRVAAIKVSMKANPSYVDIAIKSKMTQDVIRKAKNSTNDNISMRDIKGIPIPLPPRAEQKRIVAKVDELMALCDRLEAQQQAREEQSRQLACASLARFATAPIPSNLNYLFHPSYNIPPSDLRKSILTLAVQGKLVPQDPNDEPAARALERIDATPKRAMRTRFTGEDESNGPTELAPLFKLPPGWEWAQFRRLPLQASVGIDRGRSMQGPHKAFGYFKMNNIRNSGGIDLSDLTRIDATPDEIEAFTLSHGDFLFNTRNSRELVGKTCVFSALPEEPILYNNNILRVKFINGFSPDFLDYWFRSPMGSEELEKLKSNTTNVCAIYQGKLLGFPCVVPPLAEQHRIVAKVAQLMALVDELETQLTTSRTTIAALLDAIVHELTNGGAYHTMEA